KKSLMWADCIVIAGALLVGFSKMADSFEMVLASRLSYGVAAGICLNATAPFLVEISPKRLRGFAVAMSVVFFSLGKVLGQIMGLRDVFGGPSRWPLLLGLSGLPALVQLLLLPLFSESPAFLLLQKGDKEGCLRAMRTLWGEGDPRGHGLQAQAEEMRRESSPGRRGALQVMGDPAQRRPLALSILLALSLQLCGLSAIYFYAFEVFRTARIQENLIPYMTLGTGSCEFVAVLLCSAIIDRFGRRVLLWGGFGMMGVAMALLTLSLSLQDRFPWLSFASVAFIFLFIFFFGVGPCESRPPKAPSRQ
ncbi:solute carrier family 2, facilitated glucose transporter member 11-like, partial [Sceloporus undulatus]|uniref:solute carrier family 2, facilitated glucose transporter member 11-like n=1 Tax=Sceloporus undulatus TaxID=8520 RepID=UPI001C4A86B9